MGWASLTSREYADWRMKRLILYAVVCGAMTVAVALDPVRSQSRPPAPPKRPPEVLKRLSLEAETPGLADPFRGHHEQRPGRAWPVQHHVDGCVDRAGPRRRRGLPRRPHRAAARHDAQDGGRPRVAEVDEPELLRPGRRRLPGHVTRAARGGLRAAARRAERTRAEADARHHAPQRDARRAQRRQLRRAGRMAVLPDGHGDAVGDRAVGMAVRRPSRRHQLLRARRSGGDVAALRRLGARHRDVGQVQGHVGAAGRAEPGPGLRERALAGAARQGHPAVGRQGRGPESHRGLEGQRRAGLRRPSGHARCRRHSGNSC